MQRLIVLLESSDAKGKVAFVIRVNLTSPPLEDGVLIALKSLQPTLRGPLVVEAARMHLHYLKAGIGGDDKILDARAKPARKDDCVGVAHIFKILSAPGKNVRRDRLKSEKG